MTKLMLNCLKTSAGSFTYLLLPPGFICVCRLAEYLIIHWTEFDETLMVIIQRASTTDRPH